MIVRIWDFADEIWCCADCALLNVSNVMTADLFYVLCRKVFCFWCILEFNSISWEQHWLILWWIFFSALSWVSCDDFLLFWCCDDVQIKSVSVFFRWLTTSSCFLILWTIKQQSWFIIMLRKSSCIWQKMLFRTWVKCKNSDKFNKINQLYIVMWVCHDVMYCWCSRVKCCISCHKTWHVHLIIT